jgi:hypothetical protein
VGLEQLVYLERIARQELLARLLAMLVVLEI